MYVPFSWQTRLATPGAPFLLTVGSSIGIEESRESDETKTRRTVNGTAVQFRGLFDTYFRISVSASGPAVRWSPNLLSLPRTGAFGWYSTKHMSQAIAPGQTQVTLPRDVVPGCVLRLFRADDLNEAPASVIATPPAGVAPVSIPTTLNGRVLTLAQACPDALSVQFLPAFMVVLNRFRESGKEIEGTAAWSMEVEESTPGTAIVGAQS
ncbi:MULTISPECIES: hypothetical protein [unclassified Methylobacterium]|jgi:hypothetical protein|uniref:hypothetical protein n=1 Tax=unclassified Methylobacterium TaxID=2615210 RepID=UPI0013542621|nr:hypothetical protein [Methylobacterium sp. 2A]MWV22461.1 hypothetical protein [Methylobacterium sp. 2A]